MYQKWCKCTCFMDIWVWMFETPQMSKFKFLHLGFN